MTNTNVTVIKDNSRGASQGWVMTDKKAHQAMSKLGVKHPMALAILHHLTSKMNRGTNAIMVSYEAIAHELGIVKRTVQKSVGVLEANNFVQILKSGKSNVYVINHQVAWQGVRGARFASFGAEILISEIEQIKAVDELIEESKTLQTVPIMEYDERAWVQNDEIEPPDQQEMDLP